jgi:hypothetical protein
VAYISDATLKTAVAKRLGTTTTETDTAMSHLESIVSDANEQAYNTILSVMLGQGYVKATIDQWDRRVEFNRRLGVCIAFRELALGKDYDLTALDQVCKCEEELKTVTITVDGVIVAPDGSGTSVTHGTMDTDDDVFSMETEW